MTRKATKGVAPGETGDRARTGDSRRAVADATEIVARLRQRHHGYVGRDFGDSADIVRQSRDERCRSS